MAMMMMMTATTTITRCTVLLVSWLSSSLDLELFTTEAPASADLTPLEFSSFALELLVALLSLEVATFQNE